MMSKNAGLRQFRLFGLSRCMVLAGALFAISLGSGLVACAEGTGLNYDSATADYATPAHAAPPPDEERDMGGHNTDPNTPAGPFNQYPPGAIATLGDTAIDANHTTVLIYDAEPTAKSAAIITLQAPTAPGGIAALAFDGKRQLYTLDFSGRVSVFTSGASGIATPVRVINPQGLYTNDDTSYAQGLAIDSKGEIAISIDTGFDQSDPDHVGREAVVIYAPDADGDAEPVRAISGANTGFRLPIDLAFDAKDNLYVGDYVAHSVFVFEDGAYGNVSPQRTACVTEGLQAMAVAPDGTLYVAPEGVPEWSVRVYAPFDGSSQKLAGIIQGASTGLDSPDEGPLGLALDPWGNLDLIGSQSGLRFGHGLLGDVTPLSSFNGWNELAVAPRGDAKSN